MYLGNCWYMAGWSADFSATGLTPMTLRDEPVAFYRTATGALVALEDRAAIASRRSRTGASRAATCAACTVEKLLAEEAAAADACTVVGA